MERCNIIMDTEFSDTITEIENIKKAIATLEHRIDSIPHLTVENTNCINDLLENAWGLLENHRAVFQELSDYKEDK